MACRSYEKKPDFAVYTENDVLYRCNTVFAFDSTGVWQMYGVHLLQSSRKEKSSRFQVPGTVVQRRDVTSVVVSLHFMFYLEYNKYLYLVLEYSIFVRTIRFTIDQLESRASAQPHSTSLTCVAAQLFDGSCPLSPIKQKNRTHHLKVNGNHELPHSCRTCKLRHLRRWVNEMSSNKRYGCLESMNWTMLWSTECWCYSTFVDSSQIIDGEIPELNAEIKNSPRQGSHNFEQIRSLPSRRRPMIVLEVPTLWCLYA